MRALLINPYDRSIAEIDCSGELSGMQHALRKTNRGHYRGVCHVRLSANDDLWLDDEGMLYPGMPIFQLKGYGNPLAGAALVLGHDRGGDSAPASVQLRALSDLIEFTDLESAGKLTDGFQIGAGHFHMGYPILRRRVASLRYGEDGKCHNAEPGTYNHECGKPATWVGARPDGFKSCFCNEHKANGSEARAYKSWAPFCQTCNNLTHVIIQGEERACPDCQPKMAQEETREHELDNGQFGAGA